MGVFERALVTVTLQLINLLLYPRNRQRRFQGYIIGDLKVQRCKKWDCLQNVITDQEDSGLNKGS
jgi:hypothetical protein